METADMKGIWEGALGYCVDLPNVFSVSPVARAPRRAGKGRRRRGEMEGWRRRLRLRPVHKELGEIPWWVLHFHSCAQRRKHRKRLEEFPADKFNNIRKWKTAISRGYEELQRLVWTDWSLWFFPVCSISSTMVYTLFSQVSMNWLHGCQGEQWHSVQSSQLRLTSASKFVWEANFLKSHMKLSLPSWTSLFVPSLNMNHPILLQSSALCYSVIGYL